ncbi:MAG: AAA family ATPase [Phycisphaerales bacterium]
MLPVNGDLTPEQINYVRNELEQWIIVNDHDHAYIDAQLKCTRGSTAKFREGKYQFDQSKFARRVDRWLKQKDLGNGSMPTQYVSTVIAEKMIGTLRKIKSTKSMGSIVGPSGVSKSTVREYCVSGHIEGCDGFELSETDRTMGQMLKRMAFDLGAPKSTTSQQAMFFLRQHYTGTDILIIVDEAHYLEKRAMNALRDLHKSTKCPICLMGTRDLLQTINDFDEFHGQMKSLFSFTYNITVEEQSEGGTPLYTVDELAKFATSMGLKLDITGACKITNLANLLGWGGLRAAGYLLLNAASLAKGRPITEKAINDAHKQMSGSDGFALVNAKLELANKKMAVAS